MGNNNNPGVFDAETALREEIEGISNILTTLSSQASHAEMRASEAAEQYNALTKLKAYTQGELARKRAVLHQLQQEKAGK